VTENTDGFAVVASQRKQLSDDVPLCDDLETLIDTLPIEHAANLMAYAVEISRGIRSAVVGLIAAGNALLKTKSLLSDDEWTRYATAVTGGTSTPTTVRRSIVFDRLVTSPVSAKGERVNVPAMSSR
jgi:hypothetical protein